MPLLRHAVMVPSVAGSHTLGPSILTDDGATAPPGRGVGLLTAVAALALGL